MENLNSNVQQIKKALEQTSEGLVLYAATQLTQKLIIELAKQGVTPLCICDSNSALHGNKIFGLEVMHIDVAKEQFGDFLLYITNDIFLYEIIAQLEVSGKFAKERIINYVPAVKKKGCKGLINNCVILGDRVYFCYADHERDWEDLPHVLFEGDYDKLVTDFIEFRESTLNELQKGMSSECSHCQMIHDIYTPEDQSLAITSISDTGFKVCNFKCIYCAAPKKFPKTIDSWKLIQAFRKKNLISEGAQFQFSSGEVSIFPNRNEIYQCMSMFHRNNIYTNALIYDPEISNLLKSGKASICVSMDAGTRETFAKVKGLDVYEQVCDTLRQYATETSEAAIKLNYILLPGINNNAADIDGFFKLAKEINAYQVCVCSDIKNPHLVTEHTIETAKYFCEKAESLSIPFLTNSRIIGKALGIYCNHQIDY